MISPGSCSKGIEISCHRVADRGNRFRVKGLEVNSEKDRKPIAMAPITDNTRDSTRATATAGLNKATAAVHSGQYQGPQQEGALVVAPHGGEFIDRREQAVGVGRHQGSQ